MLTNIQANIQQFGCNVKFVLHLCHFLTSLFKTKIVTATLVRSSYIVRVPRRFKKSTIKITTRYILPANACFITCKIRPLNGYFP